MYKIVNNKQPFQSVSNGFAFYINENVTAKLYVSVDGGTYYPYQEDIVAPDYVIVCNCVPDMFFYIDGITEPIKILL